MLKAIVPLLGKIGVKLITSLITERFIRGLAIALLKWAAEQTTNDLLKSTALLVEKEWTITKKWQGSWEEENKQ